MPRAFNSYNRWYDRNPNITNAFSQFLDMEAVEKQVFGHVIVTVTTKLREINKKSQSHLTLGADRATGLIKAQEKRRTLDQDRNIHKAMTNLFILTDNQRNVLSTRVGISVNCAEIYRMACLRHGKTDDLRELAMLVSMALEKGLYGPRVLMTNLELMDAQAEKEFEALARLFDEEIRPVRLVSRQPDMRSPEKLIQQVSDMSMLEPAKKLRTHLRQDDDGIKIHKQDPL